MSLKLMSDFDGVLTDLNQEASRVREIFEQALMGAVLVSDQVTGATGAPLVTQTQLQSIIDDVSTNGASHGWRDQGRISAYADEDHFIYNNGLAAAIDDWRDSISEKRLFIVQGRQFDRVVQLAQWAYEKMVQEVMNDAHASPLDQPVPNLFTNLANQGVSITIVSNSSTKRIEDILSKSGSKTSVQVRGNAGKFGLTPDASQVKAITFGGRSVEVSRPGYESTIREILPDVIIGDVFSLDLAVGYALAQARPELFPRGLTLVLRIRDYTPSWVLQEFAEFKRGQRSLPGGSQSGSGKVRLIGIKEIEALEDLFQVLSAQSLSHGVQRLPTQETIASSGHADSITI